MKLVSLLAVALSFARIAPSLASYQFDSTHMASRDWADEPFNLNAREYRVYERDLDERDWDEHDLDERDLDERDFDIESFEDLLEREDFDLWERDEENFLYPRAPTDAYKKVIALNSNMQAGRFYAFEMTFPLTDKEKTPARGETPEQKRMREMQLKLGYSHKALLVGEVTSNLDFKGELYHMALLGEHSWRTLSLSFAWKVDSSVPLASKGEIKRGWTKEKIIKAG
jgi:hypothetical protein